MAARLFPFLAAGLPWRQVRCQCVTLRPRSPPGAGPWCGCRLFGDAGRPVWRRRMACSAPSNRPFRNALAARQLAGRALPPPMGRKHRRRPRRRPRAWAVAVLLASMYARASHKGLAAQARRPQGRKVPRRPAQASFPVRRRQVCRPRQSSWACSLPFTIILLFLHIPSGKIHCP